MKRLITSARKPKWVVYGPYGGEFTNLDDAKRTAKESSKYEDSELPYEASVYLIEDGSSYIDYKHGKLVRDGWRRN